MRKKIERAIYFTGNNYSVIGYSKETKKTKTLASFNNIKDARAFRDKEIRRAVYGKGIRKVGNKYHAEICCLAKTKVYVVHIGYFNSPEEARKARLVYIEKLK